MNSDSEDRLPKTEKTKVQNRIFAEPLEDMRHPLTALVCMLPLVLIGELYRITTLKSHSLLADDIISRLAQSLGIHAPLMPAWLLLIVCLIWTVCGAKQWRLPTNFVLWRVCYWSMIWAALRCLISFTSGEMQTDDLKLFGDIGTCMSGASQEELFFRALCIGFIAWCVSLFGISREFVMWLLLAPSAILFALAHTYVMNQSLSPEDWENARFIELIAAGCLYGYIYIRQGLATATLSHFTYNLIVLSGILSFF